MVDNWKTDSLEAGKNLQSTVKKSKIDLLSHNPNNLTFEKEITSEGDANKEKYKFPTSLDIRVRLLKKRLDPWKEFILAAESFLLWEKKWYPFALYGSLGLIFLIIYASQIPPLTLFSLIGIIALLSDYAIPLICSKYLRTEGWDGVKEKRLEQLCRNIYDIYDKAERIYTVYVSSRATSPLVFYAVGFGVLSLIAWMGSTFNNLALIAAFLTILLTAPVLQRIGLTGTFKVMGKKQKDRRNDFL